MNAGPNSWATLQLAEFVGAISSCENEAAARMTAVERAAEAFAAEAAALAEEGRVTASVGFPRAHVPEDQLIAATYDKRGEIDVPGIGACGFISTPLGSKDPSGLVLAWGSAPRLDAEEAGLLRGMVRVLTLTLNRLRVLESERSLRAALEERQRLSERLSLIQRSIARRVSTAEIFDAITSGAKDLLRVEVAGLRLVDPDDPTILVLHSVCGMDAEVARRARRTPMGQGVGGTAFQRGHVFVVDDYEGWDGAIPSFAPGLAASMAAPIFDEGEVAGSLSVSTRDQDRTFSAAEQEILESFAEHASLALTGARAVEARHRHAIQKRERRFRALVHANSDMVTVLDAGWRLEYESPSVARSLGYEPGDLDRTRVLDLVAAPDQRSVAEFLSAVERKSGVVVSIECCLNHLDGSLVPVEVVANNLLDDPDVGGIVLTARDLTERKRAEERRQELEHQLQQAQRLESVGQLAGGIAHDFSNLLIVIQNYATFIGEGVAEDSAIARDAEQVRVAAERGTDLVRQLLTFSRRQIANPEVVDLRSAVAETDTMLRRSLGELYALETSVGEEVRRVRIDPGHLDQVLVNLVVNARDAMPGGGRIRIAAENVAVNGNRPTALADLPSGPYVRLAVIDNGEGMPTEVAHQAFEPFFTTKPAGEGTGLGLATVYGIVSQAGGAIDIDSEIGRGTTMSIYLPAVGDAPARPKPDAGHGSTGPADDERGSILVVEDEPAVKALTTRILERHGHRVIATESPAEALALFQAGDERIDLLVTDVVMPEMTGCELAERATEIRPDLSVLLVSGYTGDFVETDGVEPGTPLLQKPFTAEALLEAVGTELRDRRMAETAHLA